MAKSANRSVRLEKGLRLFKPSYTSNGRKGTAKRWYVEFPYLRQARRLPGYADQQLTAELARKVVTLARWREAGESPDPAILRWVETLPDQVREPLVRWGLVDERRTKTLTTHLEDWKAVLLAGGNTACHADLVVNRARRTFEGCRFKRFGDISASRLQTHLADLRKDRTVKVKGPGDETGGVKIVRGISAQTFNFYLAACKQFCRWMMKDGRAHENPLAHLSGLNVKTDRRHDRRALSVEELQQLLNTTETQPERCGIGGGERALLYRLAVETGLRAGELRSLTRSSVALEGDEPSVTIEAAYAKNRRQDTLPLRPALARRLADHLKQKMPQALAFEVPSPTMLGRIFQDDLAAARQAWLSDAQTAQERTEREKTGFCTYRDDAGRVADFHALRHTFISNLAAGGVHPKTAQQLARHSTIKLTMDRYSHTMRENLSAALNVLPDLPDAKGQDQKKTGTDDVPVNAAQEEENRLALCLAHLAGKSGDERSRTQRVKGKNSAGENRCNWTGWINPDQVRKRGTSPSGKPRLSRGLGGLVDSRGAVEGLLGPRADFRCFSHDSLNRGHFAGESVTVIRCWS